MRFNLQGKSDVGQGTFCVSYLIFNFQRIIAEGTALHSTHPYPRGSQSTTCPISLLHIILPEYELTLPASRGQLTTVEGLIRDIVADLSGDQPLRRIQDEPTYNKIQALIDSLKKILGEDEDESDIADPPKVAEKHDNPMPVFTIKLDDPSGNSFIEFIDSMADPKWNLRTYSRTRQQNIDLGFSVADEEPSPAILPCPRWRKTQLAMVMIPTRRYLSSQAFARVVAFHSIL
jgi:C4-type Zn-finger protein